MRPRKASIACLLLLGAAAEFGHAGPKAGAEILFISSANSLERNYLMSQAFLKAWHARDPGATLFPLIFPAFSYPPTEKDYELTRETMAERLKDRKPSLIVAQGIPSLQLAVSLRDARFPAASILAFEINESVRSLYAGAASLYILESTDYIQANVALALRLMPRAKRVILLLHAGSARDFYLAYMEEMKRTFPGVEFATLFDPSPSSSDATLRSAGKDSVIVNFSPGWVDSRGRYIFSKELAGFLSDTYGLPVFEFLREDAGSGLVGGVGVSAPTWGRAAADMGLALLLDGKAPAYWNSSSGLARAFVDHDALLRFGSSLRLAPEGAEIINLPPSSWIRYRIAFQSGIVLMMLALFALAARLYYRRRERGLLMRANEGLEREVSIKTAELRASNEELGVSNGNLVAAMRRMEGMQESVLRSAKEITLGRLAAGIANELNSPLSATRSANAVVRSLARDEAGGLPGLLLAMDDSQRSLFGRYAPRVVARPARSRPGSGSLRTGRARRLELERRLERNRCPNPASVAADLEEAGLLDLDEEGAAEFSRDGAGSVAQALYELGLIDESTRIIDDAVDRAVVAIEAVREYNDETDPKGAEDEVSLPGTIERALSFFKDRIPASISVRTDFQETPPARGSEALFVRMWIHLIQNALQSMAGGGTLAISLRRDGGYALVVVDDEGAGIPREISERIFEPFFTTKPLAEGMGLGLAYCKRIVDSLRGSIGFAGKATKGTAFSIRLPLFEAG
jgi:signal transduction histidine kinase